MTPHGVTVLENVQNTINVAFFLSSDRICGTPCKEEVVDFTKCVCEELSQSSGFRNALFHIFQDFSTNSPISLGTSFYLSASAPDSFPIYRFKPFILQVLIRKVILFLKRYLLIISYKERRNLNLYHRGRQKQGLKLDQASDNVSSFLLELIPSGKGSSNNREQTDFHKYSAL